MKIKQTLILSLFLVFLGMTACGEAAPDTPVQTSAAVSVTEAESTSAESITEPEETSLNADETTAAAVKEKAAETSTGTETQQETQVTAETPDEPAAETTAAKSSALSTVEKKTDAEKTSITRGTSKPADEHPKPDDKRCTDIIEAREYAEELRFGCTDAIEYDTGDVKVFDEGKYYRVTKSEFSDIQEMKEYFCNYALPELVEEQIFNFSAYYPCFMEFDGKLYIRPCDRSLYYQFDYTEGTPELQKVSDDEYLLRLYLDNEHGRYIYDFTLGYVGGQWIITGEEYDVIEDEDEYDYVDDDEILGADPDTWGSYSGDYEIYDGFSVSISIFNDCTGYAVYDEDYCRIGSLLNDTDIALDNWNVIADDIDGDGENELGAALENGETLWFAYDEYGVLSDSNTGGCFVRVKKTAE